MLECVGLIKACGRKFTTFQYHIYLCRGKGAPPPELMTPPPHLSAAHRALFSSSPVSPPGDGAGKGVRCLSAGYPRTSHYYAANTEKQNFVSKARTFRCRPCNISLHAIQALYCHILLYFLRLMTDNLSLKKSLETKM